MGTIDLISVCVAHTDLSTNMLEHMPDPPVPKVGLAGGALLGRES